MIPYKWMDLTARDQTGVLLGTIHRLANKTQNAADIEEEVFQVPTENGFLLTSYSVQCVGSSVIPTAFPVSLELRIKDAQGNTLSELKDTPASVWLTSVTISERASITRAASPIVVIGPGLRIFGRIRLTAATASNQLTVSINGVLIPRGTMAFQQ